MLSFGYSVGDFNAISTHAWTLYESCKVAPESFDNIASDLLAFHALLQNAEKITFAAPLPVAQQQQLKTIGDGCKDVLEELSKIVQKYETLGTDNKNTWQQMKWYCNDIAEIRLRLLSSGGDLNGFLRYFCEQCYIPILTRLL
jgi:hypothetical protein